MKMQRMAWLGLISGFGCVAALAAACSGADTTNGGAGICGNGVTEGTEECDDGNANDADACSNTCTNGGASTASGMGGSTASGGVLCGNGTLDSGEECDDGDTDDTNACGNDCKGNSVNCGNGKIDANEECDDGNKVADDGCTNVCSLPTCGDGVVQMGEDCDDGMSEFNDKCPDDCKNPGTTSGTGGAGGTPCVDDKIVSGVVSSDANPNMTGAGIKAVWSYNAKLGVAAGNAMCKAIGADHVCTYAEIVAADAKGELANLATNLTYWTHRTTSVTADGTTFAPGAGARCNDWTYPTDHISDGEWFEVYNANSASNAGGHHIGSLSFHFDGNAVYDGMTGKTCKSATDPKCAGPCSSPTRAILCCNPICN